MVSAEDRRDHKEAAPVFFYHPGHSGPFSGWLLGGCPDWWHGGGSVSRLAFVWAVCVNCLRQRGCFPLERLWINFSCEHPSGQHGQNSTVLAFRRYSIFGALSRLRAHVGCASQCRIHPRILMVRVMSYRRSRDALALPSTFSASSHVWQRASAWRPEALANSPHPLPHLPTQDEAALCQDASFVGAPLFCSRLAACLSSPGSACTVALLAQRRTDSG